MQRFPENTPKKDYVLELFNNLAKNYDLLNDVITFGMHKRIKKQAVNNVPVKHAAKILDVCCGTGDISIFASKRFGSEAEITGVDFSENMLEIFRGKTKDYKNISCIKADALDLPFGDETFDIVFISFGLRNLEDYKLGILELKRVVKKGGFVVNLDTGKPKGVLGIVGKVFFSLVVPFLGKIFNRNAEPYRYLSDSREEFPSQQELTNIFKEAGFSVVKNHDFLFGMIAEQVAQK